MKESKEKRKAPASKNRGIIYLIHFDKPVGLPDPERANRGRSPRRGPVFGASHYIGFTTDLENRLAEHKSGAGSRLCAQAVRYSISFAIVRTWAGSRALERKIKQTHRLKAYCPICKDEVLRKHREWYKTRPGARDPGPVTVEPARHPRRGPRQ